MATVAGIGLNLNQGAEDFASAGLPDATSLAAVCGGRYTVETAARLLLTKLDADYDRLLATFRPL